MSNNHSKSIGLARAVSALSNVGVKLVIIGNSGGFQSELTKALEENNLSPDKVVVIDALQPKVEMTLKAFPEPDMPVVFREEKEWWLGGNPRYRK